MNVKEAIKEAISAEEKIMLMALTALSESYRKTWKQYRGFDIRTYRKPTEQLLIDKTKAETQIHILMVVFGSGRTKEEITNKITELALEQGFLTRTKDQIKNTLDPENPDKFSVKINGKNRDQT